jgi:hypothetical protein
VLKKRSNSFQGGWFYVFLLPIFLIGGGFLCDNEVTKKERVTDSKVVARVNESVLLEDELEDALLEFFGEFYSDEDKHDYINQWVESELLHQQAFEEGLQKDEEIQKKISQFQRMLLEQEILRRYLEGRVEISDEAISTYYADNSDFFLRNEDEYRVNKLVFQSEEIAREVVGELEIAPERYDELIFGEVYDGKITVINLGFYPVSKLETNFGDQLNDLEVGQFSQPIITPAGNCYALRMDEYREKGSTRELDEVEYLIRNILFGMQSDNAKQEWLEELKKSADIEIAVD